MSNTTALEAQRDTLVNELTGLAQRAGEVQAAIAELNRQIHAAKHESLFTDFQWRRQQADLAAQQRIDAASKVRAAQDAEHLAKLNSNVDVGKKIKQEMAEQFGFRP